MNILECFETGAFNELIRFSFEEVRAAFNLNGYFVSSEQMDRFVCEATQVKTKYTEELNKVEQYAQGEYTVKINSGDEVPEFETPQFKVKAVETQTKRQLIKLIAEYFNRDLFQSNKTFLYGHELFKEETVEAPHELLIALNVNKTKIYSLLSILGYYQRNYGYFLSRTDFLAICYDYSHQVHIINKNLGTVFLINTPTSHLYTRLKSEQQTTPPIARVGVKIGVKSAYSGFSLILLLQQNRPKNK